MPPRRTRVLLPLAVLAAVAIPALAESTVRVWQGTMRLPTYTEGAPDVNPPFDAFAHTRFNYPYTLRERLTGKRVEQEWRALYLENEYLKCSVLPDVGGHLYSCTDKINGREMFYANPSLKKARIGYRGAWAAFGIEFNFPVSHNWVSMSPVDFATAQNNDGTASIWVGNTDRPYGMRWLIELRLAPGSAVLQQRVRLMNPTPTRHRFYWWNNAGIEVWDDSRIWYPMRWTASHGFTEIDTWPVNQAGLDLSVIRNHTAGPVSQFAYGSREPFMGVYHPRTRSGTVHYAKYAELPHKKIWSWGVDPDGLEWREALSDNRSGYVEVQAGLFRNQETYGFLEPGQELKFAEYWMPVREIGGVTRANLTAAIHMERTGGRLAVGLNVYRKIPGATVRLRSGNSLLSSDPVELDPASVWRKSIDTGEAPVTFELLGPGAEVLLAHTDGVHDWVREDEVRVGAQPRKRLPAAERRTDGEWLEAGTDQELNGRKLVALETYKHGVQQFPNSQLLARAAGRVAVDLERYDDAIRWLRSAQNHESNDPEVHYYLGVALAAAGDQRSARTELEGAYRSPRFRDAARIELGRIDARSGNLTEALRWLTGTVYELPLLRALKRDRQQQIEHWLKQDPANTFVRLEAGAAPELVRHLGADPERVLAAAAEYMKLGMWADALALVSRTYPPVDAAEREPGSVAPQDHPLVSYYRAYLRTKLGDLSANDDLVQASRQSILYVFPHRLMTRAVLEHALHANANDATALFFMGSLSLASGLTDRAVEYWERTRSLNPKQVSLHRNLARTLLQVKRDFARAAQVYREGMDADPENVEVYTGLGQALTLLGRPTSDRLAAIERFPRDRQMPDELVFELALTLAEAGRFDNADRLLQGRSFILEEGGTSVRQVQLEIEIEQALASRRSLASRRGTPSEPGRSGPRYEYLAGLAASGAGNHELAREHWARAAGDNNEAEMAYAYKAARQMPGFDSTGWKSRLQKALEALDADAEAAPGPSQFWRGTMLRALGREREAVEAFREAVLLPDINLSRYLARTELSRAH